MTREQQLIDFLGQTGWHKARRTAIPGDASFRHYARLEQPERRAILMDAPPPHEDVRPFMAVLGALRSYGYAAPALYHADQDAGFLVLEDLGDDRFSRVIARDPGLESGLYGVAVDLLVDLHSHQPPTRLPVTDGGADHPLPLYDKALLLREAALFGDYYYPAFASPQMGADEQAADVEDVDRLNTIWAQLLDQSKICDPDDPVLVLRDYHADNLMWLPSRDGFQKIGLLDFQDAVRGHRAYDLVSLLQDARRDVSPDLERRMIRHYLEGAKAAGQPIPEAAFIDDYTLLGAQRAIKIIGIFTRLWKRDGKDRYLQHLPRMWGLLERNLEHPALCDLKAQLDRMIPAHQRQRTLPSRDRML
ncbi:MULTISPECIES: phosphotransferase [unclassified Iodidimonas]|jgi:aminoglycoside/choline kinase family phosphotransferase|uniref:aminoglycoside phosphotransferase family protein n=1 Tax=unclassified Iodidimonas TaxID=2626145 RepID=UPI002482666F|nr:MULTISPECIES: phosphotransferase [unclassified Iodidimonas]